VYDGAAEAQQHQIRVNIAQPTYPNPLSESTVRIQGVQLVNTDWMGLLCNKDSLPLPTSR